MSYPIRALSFTEILDVSFKVLRDSFLPLVAIGSVFYVPFQILMNSGDPFLVLAGFGYAAVIQAPVFLMLNLAIAHRYLGHGPQPFVSLVREMLSLVLPFLGTLLVFLVLWMLLFALASGLAVLVSLPLPPAARVIFLVLGVMAASVVLIVESILISPIVVIERIYVLRAIKRARELRRGFWWRTVGIWICTTIVVVLLTQGPVLVLRYVPWVGSVLSGVIGGASLAFTVIVSQLMYFDLRCRKENLDLMLLSAKVQASTLGTEGTATAPS